MVMLTDILVLSLRPDILRQRPILEASYSMAEVLAQNMEGGIYKYIF